MQTEGFAGMGDRPAKNILTRRANQGHVFSIPPSADCPKVLADNALRHSGQAHAFVDPLASCEVGGIAAPRAGAVATDGEIRMENKSRLHGGMRLVEMTELRQGGGEREMCKGMISVCLDASTKPARCFGVRVEL